MRPFAAISVALLLVPSLLRAADLTVDVRDAHGKPAADIVVYAIPEGKKSPLVKKTAVLDQKNRMFTPHILPIQTGTAVTFPNSDDIRHQVYSFSAAKAFQLPLYKGTPAKPVVFDKPGVISLGCNIHDQMSAYIVVVDTPWFATAARSGRVELTNLSEGAYVVHVWSPDVHTEPAPISLSLTAEDHKAIAFTVRKE